LVVEGKLQKEGQVIHVVMRKCYDESGLLNKLGEEETKPQPIRKSKFDKGVQLEIFPKGRNFH